MVGGSGNRSSDYSKAMEKHGAASFDFRKGMKKATPETVDVESGATEDSISDFVEATQAAKANREQAKSSGGFLRRLFRRT